MLSGSEDREKSTARCRVEAAAWRVHLTEKGQASTPDLEVWLAADVRHRAAWDEVQRSWRLLDEGQANPDLIRLRSETLERVLARVRQRSQRSPSRLSQRIAFGVGCAAILALVTTLWLWTRPDVYRTGPAERLSLTLADGSRVELDSSSDLSVRYSSTARELSLARGQARFIVAHDAERPFSVATVSRKIVATGTDFDVDLLAGKLYVTLLEGRLLILPSREQAAAGIASGRLEAGEQLTVSASGMARIEPGNRDRVIAWQNRQIIFDDEPLASAIERINRYSSEHLVLADSAVGALRISGVFRAGNLGGFVDTLTHYLPVDSERRRGLILLRTRPQNALPPSERREQAAQPDTAHAR